MNETKRQIAEAIRRYREEREIKILEFIKSLSRS